MRISNLKKGISNLGVRSGEFFQRHPLVYSSWPLISRGIASIAGLAMGVLYLDGAEASSHYAHINGDIVNNVWPLHA